MKITVRELVIFAVFAALMFASKIIMQFLPNIHLLGLFIVSLTVVYRAKALLPIYVYVFLDGLFHGFNLWWAPYLYIWAVLWAFTMLLPKNMPINVQLVVYPLTSALHGLLFGTLYAPFQALAFGLNFEGMLSWIIVGLPFDLTHAISNLIIGFAIVPMIQIIRMCNNKKTS